MPFEVLERGGGGEDQDMFEVGGDPNDPILEVRAEAMEFVDDEHVEAARVDVSEGEPLVSLLHHAILNCSSQAKRMY